jgi:hypothetical protein
MFWHIMRYHADMAGDNCAVLVFGDSTGITGIDPLLVEKQTGSKTCVLSLPYMALATTGTRILDDYLKRNAKPKLLIIANSAGHLRTPTLDEDWGMIDGWLLVDQLMPTLQAARFYLHHPKDSMVFVENVWQQVFTLSPKVQMDVTGATYRSDLALLQQHHGYYPMESSMDPALVCSKQEPPPSFDANYLSALRSRYESSATKVLVYASPVRACDSNISSYGQIARRLGISPPHVLPAGDFADPWHLNTLGAEVNSRIIAQIVATTLDRNGSAGPTHDLVAQN